MKDFIIAFLKQEGVTYQIQGEKLVISDEFQEEKFDVELGFGVPYFLTEWNYPASLSETLSEFNNTLDREYGHIFECDWDGTFSIILEEDTEIV